MPSRSTIATWFFSNAHHRLVSFCRLSGPSLAWESLAAILAVDQNPEVRLIEAETLAQIRRLVEALPQPEQELLALRFATRLSSADIAAIIGKSEAATKKQLTRLLHRLQEQYRREVLEEQLLDLMEPALPAFAAALLHAYAVPLPFGRFHDGSHQLLKQVALFV